ERIKKINKAAKELVKYIKANKIDPSTIIPGQFKIGNVIWNQQVVAQALSILEEEQKRKEQKARERQEAKLAKERAEALKNQPNETSESEDIVDDEVWDHFQKTNELDIEYKAEIINEIYKKLLDGEILTDREDKIYHRYKSVFDKKFKLIGKTPIYKTRSSNTGVSFKQQEPIIISIEDNQQDIKDSLTEIQSQGDKLTAQKTDDSFIMLRRSDLEVTTKDGKIENVYEDGKVI